LIKSIRRTSIQKFFVNLFLGISLGLFYWGNAHSQKSFERGEYISYLCHYGFIHAGRFQVFVDTQIVEIGNKPCYKTEMIGQTIGAVGVFADIYDKWTSFIDTNTLLSHRFIRDVRENNYTLYEITEFDRENNLALVTTRQKDNTYELKTYPIKPAIQDMVSTYFQLRNMDLSRLRKNDTLAIRVFLQDTTFTVQVRFDRREKLKTSMGKFKCVVFIPIVPKVENTVLKDEKPIEAWITDDARKLPLKIKVNSRYGAVEADIELYGNIKNLKPK